MNKKIIVTGIGTEVGKTVVSAILVNLLQADYWKPVECGLDSDSEIIKTLIDTKQHHIHPPAYSLKNPLSPHHAARLENIIIDPRKIVIPQTEKTLVIETAGGIFVPLTKDFTSLDLFASWDCKWVIVSKHYLGSINHTLLTIAALKQRQIDIMGIIFNGVNQDSEEAILSISKLPFLGRLILEKEIDKNTIYKYAQIWKSQKQFLS